MKKNSKKQTQLDKYSEKLKAIACDVNAEDKKLYMSKYEKSEATVSRYLNGDVKSTSIANSMYVFFKNKIDKRNEVLA